MSVSEAGPLVASPPSVVQLSLPRAARRHHPRRVSLRAMLLTLLVGLLVATVASIGAVQWVTSVRSIQDLQSRSFRMLATTITSQVQSFLEPGMLVLEEATTRAQYGRLVVEDSETLANYLVDRLRFQRSLSWVSYSDEATGRFVGAWRDEDGRIILNTSAPYVNDGRPTEVVVHVDGSRTAFARDLRGGYDPREKDWYQRAAASERVIWTDPFEFNEGRKGVTAALALRPVDGGAVRGVFTADIFLDDLARFLGNVLEQQPGKATVLSRKGDVVARSYPVDADQGSGLLRAGLAAMPMSLAAMPADEPLGFTFDYDGARYIVAGQVLRIPGGPEWATAYWMPESQFLAAVQREQQLAMGIGLLFLLAAVGLSIFLASRIASPLHSIAQDLEQVARFNLSHSARQGSFVDEIAVVRDSTDRMKASLRSFGRYVPTDLVRELLARGEEARLGGQTRCLTIHFSDVVNFTHLSEHLTPAQVVENLAEYLVAMTGALEEHGGTIDKFMGDGILAFFNAPNDLADHPALACRAALRAQEYLEALQRRCEGAGKPVFRARIGLHVGEVLVGNIGIPERFAYTVIGDAVNLASRLEELNKVYGTRTLASQEVRHAAGPAFEWRRLDRVAVAGRTGETEVNELLGLRGHVPAEMLTARDHYERALDAYFGRQFDAAATSFRAAAALASNRAAEMMYLRADAFRQYPPPADWDGVYLLRSKV